MRKALMQAQAITFNYEQDITPLRGYAKANVFS